MLDLVDSDPLLGVASDLYALLPAEFIAARKERAAAAKDDGDKDLADRIGALRKPSAAAWVVNQLMRHQAEQMDQLLELGASLRSAQADLDAAALRELSKQRRQVTAAVTRQGRALAADLGQRISEQVARQVEDTLHAAMVDEGAAAAVRSGLLTEALTSTGLGDFEPVSVVADPAAIGGTAPRAKPTKPAEPAPVELSVVPDHTREIKEAEKAAAAASRAALQARKRLEKAADKVARHDARTLQLQGELEEVRRRAIDLEHALDVTAEKREAAEDQRDEAEEALSDAEREEQAAQDRVEELTAKAQA
jgi:chromosome segregation ATPase